MRTCKHCTREVLEYVPENAGSGNCAGLECGHMRVYGLIDQDCRQVIVKKDLED